MDTRCFHQPYSRRSRFQLVRSTTTLVQRPKPKPTLPAAPRSISQFKLVRNDKPSPVKPKAATALVAKSIGNKYKWMRSNSRRTERNSFKLDHRSHGRVSKRKPRSSLTKCLVRIRGVNFHTHPNGKCLQRLTSDPDASKVLSPRKIEQPMRARANHLLQRSIQISNGRFRLRNAKKKSTKARNCIYFNRFGKCHRGDQCPFVHDRSCIAVCTQFLNGRCKNALCPYSHDLIPGKVPTCSYFIKGACGQDNCPYAHSYVGHDAQLCEDFVQGFCAKGTECSRQHVLLCPQFEATGQCSRGKQCRLTHRRKRTAPVSSRRKSEPSKSTEPLATVVLPTEMPAYIPLTQETKSTAPPVEFKLKPSFLS